MSQLKVNALVSYSGNTVTLGTSGDTINIASGVTFNTSSNIVLPAGAVGTPSLTTSGDTNTGIFFPAADTIAFTEGGAEAMRIDSSGNVVIGETSTTHKLRVVDANNRTEGTAQFSVAGLGYSLYNFLDGTAAYIGQNSNGRSLRIYSGGSSGTGVNLAAGGTSWGTYSDERLKYEIENINDAITKIKNIRCVSYKLKDVDTEISSKRLGVIAQSLVGKLDEVLDYSKKSEEDENEYISVRYSEIIPVLIKSIQEQQVIIEELKARLIALENN
jgi:hypothetical protein